VRRWGVKVRSENVRGIDGAGGSAYGGSASAWSRFPALRGGRLNFD
jgi:hypothetical protein